MQSSPQGKGGEQPRGRMGGFGRLSRTAEPFRAAAAGGGDSDYDNVHHVHVCVARKPRVPAHSQDPPASASHRKTPVKDMCTIYFREYKFSAYPMPQHKTRMVQAICPKCPPDRGEAFQASPVSFVSYRILRPRQSNSRRLFSGIDPNTIEIRLWGLDRSDSGASEFIMLKPHSLSVISYDATPVALP